MITKLRPDQSSNSHFVSDCCFIMFKLVSHTRGGANVMEKYLRPESICLCPCWPEFPFRNFCSIVFLSLNFLPQVLWATHTSLSLRTPATIFLSLVPGSHFRFPACWSWAFPLPCARPWHGREAQVPSRSPHSLWEAEPLFCLSLKSQHQTFTSPQ